MATDGHWTQRINKGKGTNSWQKKHGAVFNYGSRAGRLWVIIHRNRYVQRRAVGSYMLGLFVGEQQPEASTSLC